MSDAFFTPEIREIEHILMSRGDFNTSGKWLLSPEQRETYAQYLADNRQPLSAAYFRSDKDINPPQKKEKKNSRKANK